MPAKGLRITEPFFPGAEFVVYSEEEFWGGALDLHLDKGLRILARAVNVSDSYPEGIPVVWLNQYGQGRVVYWNSNFLSIKSLRGLLLQSLLLTRPVFVFSIANIEIIHMDDFPQPVYNLYREPVKSTLNLTDGDFYLNDWWNDILSLSKEYGIQFTCYTIFNYDAKRTPPFGGKEFYMGKNKASFQFARRVLENNFELGFHGYNHQPLVINSPGTPSWNSKENMRQSLIAARDLWRQFFPASENVFSYAAAMNLISREGKEALSGFRPDKI